MNKNVNVKKLEKKIRNEFSKCELFLALATKNYLEGLKTDDNYIRTHTRIARELNMPFIVVIDSRTSQKEIEDIRKYFSKDNVVKEIVVDIGSESGAFIVASELKQAMDCMYPCIKETIKIMTQDDIGKD